MTLEEIAAYLHWLTSVPLGITICFIGIVGNFLSIIVWARIRYRFKESTGTIRYFITMAVIDTSTLLIFLFYDSAKALNPKLEHSYWYTQIFSFFLYPLFFYFIMASVWIIVAVTVDRFVLIVYRYRIPSRTTIISLVVMFLGLFIVNVPHFFNYRPHFNSTDEVWEIELTEYGNSSAAYRYDYWVHCMFMLLVPWLIVLALNGAIVWQVYKVSRCLNDQMDTDTLTETSTKVSVMTEETTGSGSPIPTPTNQRKSQVPDYNTKSRNQRAKRDRKMTVNLLTVTFTFLLLMFWQCIAQCFWMQGDRKAKNFSNVDISFAFGKLGVVLNSSMNVFLYCFSGSLFRMELKKLFKDIFSTLKCTE